MPRARSAVAAVATSPRSFAAIALPSMTCAVTYALAGFGLGGGPRWWPSLVPLLLDPLSPPPLAAPPRSPPARSRCGSALAAGVVAGRLALVDSSPSIASGLARRVEILVPAAALELERGARDQLLELVLAARLARRLVGIAHPLLVLELAAQALH